MRAHNLDLWSQGQTAEWRNRLIWGDKKYVLPSLLPEFAGKVNLIYIDPPFDTGSDFSFTTTIPESDDELHQRAEHGRAESLPRHLGPWPGCYLQWFYETAVLLHELLAEDGSIYVHCDWHVVIMRSAAYSTRFSERTNFQNEIVWKRT